MIILIARCEVDPDALAALKPMVEETMRLTWEETDCLSYSIAVESEAAGVMIIVERWRSEAALRDYLATPVMRDFHEALQPVLISLDAKIYDAAGERPLPMPAPLPARAPGLTLVHGGNGISAA